MATTNNSQLKDKVLSVLKEATAGFSTAEIFKRLGGEKGTSLNFAQFVHFIQEGCQECMTSGDENAAPMYSLPNGGNANLNDSKKKRNGSQGSSRASTPAKDHKKFAPEKDGMLLLYTTLARYPKTVFNWNDLRNIYRKETGRHLTTEELNEMCCTHGMTKSELIDCGLSSFMKRVDKRGQLVQFAMNHSSAAKSASPSPTALVSTPPTDVPIQKECEAMPSEFLSADLYDLSAGEDNADILVNVESQIVELKYERDALTENQINERIAQREEFEKSLHEHTVSLPVDFGNTNENEEFLLKDLESDDNAESYDSKEDSVELPADVNDKTDNVKRTNNLTQSFMNAGFLEEPSRITSSGMTSFGMTSFGSALSGDMSDGLETSGEAGYVTPMEQNSMIDADVSLGPLGLDVTADSQVPLTPCYTHEITLCSSRNGTMVEMPEPDLSPLMLDDSEGDVFALVEDEKDKDRPLSPIVFISQASTTMECETPLPQELEEDEFQPAITSTVVDKQAVVTDLIFDHVDDVNSEICGGSTEDASTTSVVTVIERIPLPEKETAYDAESIETVSTCYMTESDEEEYTMNQATPMKEIPLHSVEEVTPRKNVDNSEPVSAKSVEKVQNVVVELNGPMTSEEVQPEEGGQTPDASGSSWTRRYVVELEQEKAEVEKRDLFRTMALADPPIVPEKQEPKTVDDKTLQETQPKAEDDKEEPATVTDLTFRPEEQPSPKRQKRVRVVVPRRRVFDCCNVL